ncbi:MaoC/PaaZ C-terminal domain-containing protein [Leekyejoonella antrihumi]|uniref:MaoC family dehydratase n=1 Tax=Leekyejoonella antrihumi TaxID=1660198 RepID=A0A563E852_9MICO|nr:MaoC/PaaZ C-terminal domain-containing protein [Leekyejoonella antrihumi]TWP38489.1 MaoC family dehydratase [Leekyejoonella antrihumi]
MSTTDALLASLAPRVGDTYFTSDWLEIDREHLEKFAWSTYLDPEHVDLTTSHNNPLGGDLVDGFLLLSLLLYFKFKHAPRFSEQQWGFNYGLNKVRFTAPVMLGQRLRLRSTITAVVPRGDGALVTTDNVLDVEGQVKPAMVAEWLSLWYDGGNA